MCASDFMSFGVFLHSLLKLKFPSMNEALDAIEELKKVKEGVTVKHFCREDSESMCAGRFSLALSLWFRVFIE